MDSDSPFDFLLQSASTGLDWIVDLAIQYLDIARFETLTSLPMRPVSELTLGRPGFIRFLCSVDGHGWRSPSLLDEEYDEFGGLRFACIP